MTAITWTPNYSVNVKIFDEQHKKLIMLINKMNDNINADNSENVIESIFNDLLEYTITHFNDEEQLMRKFSYPKIELHIYEHKILKEKVNDLYAKFKKGNFTSNEILSLLKDWLLTHILQTDKDYGEFFKKMGES